MPEVINSIVPKTAILIDGAFFIKRIRHLKNDKNISVEKMSRLILKASLSHQRDIDQIILISGDSDFVPAAKMARRSGIDFILDPMWNHIKDGLNEHIDGMQTIWPKPEL